MVFGVVLLRAQPARNETSASRGHYYAGPGESLLDVPLPSANYCRATVPVDGHAACSSLSVGLTDTREEGRRKTSDRGLRATVPDPVDGFSREDRAVPSRCGLPSMARRLRRLCRGRSVMAEAAALGEQPVERRHCSRLRPTKLEWGEPRSLSARRKGPHRVEWFKELAPALAPFPSCSLEPPRPSR